MNLEQAIKEALRNWCANTNGNIHADLLSDDYPLLSERIITSLQISDLLLFIQKLTENPIRIEQIKHDNFKTIEHIYKAFFGDIKQCA